MSPVVQNPARHFLNIGDLSADALRGIIKGARERKDARAGWPKGKADADRPLDGHLLALVFEKPSTRTRVSFDAAMRQLGGQTTILNAGELQLGRGETVADTARVLSAYTDGIMMRTFEQAKLDELATHASVPVINGLTDSGHPCQLMADVLTLEEQRGGVVGQTIAWSGDGNNMANSWIEGAARFGYRLRLACPQGLEPDARVMRQAQAEGAEVT